MPNNWKFEIDMNIAISYGLDLESCLILYCIKTNNNNLISSYASKCKKINTELFKSLEKQGFIIVKWDSTEKIYLDLLSLASRGEQLIATLFPTKPIGVEITNEDLEKQFGEFKKIYPSSVKQGLTTRRLHGNLSKCKKLYEKLLMETTHDILCKAAKLYIEEKYRSNSQLYIQALETWLNQKNYLQYLEDINKTINFTTIDTPNFTDDI